MNRSDLIYRIAARFPRLQFKDADAGIKTILNALSNALSKGGRTEIRGFGSLVLKYKAPRKGHNPKTGASVSVPAKYVPHFKPAKTLRAQVNNSGATL